jgi:putative proteasome-type protease
VRAHDPEMSFEDAVKLLIVSFDSTIKSNLSVGMPLDYVTYNADALEIEHAARIEADDPYYQVVSNGWGEALKLAFKQLPPFQFGD